MKKSFLHCEKPLLTAMIVCATAQECIHKIEASLRDGAEAFGIQLCRLQKQYRTEQTLTEIFAACQDKPIYITGYRHDQSSDLTDEQCAELLLLGLKCGATLIDVMGDMFCKSEKEITYNETAVRKQISLINEIHRLGGEVLMSSHTSSELTAEETLRIGKAQAMRGADIVKIVNDTKSLAELPECIRTIQCLDREIETNFLYLVKGPCDKFIRQTGPNLGVCMYLCVQSHGPLDNSGQPILNKMKAVRDNMNF